MNSNQVIPARHEISKEHQWELASLFKSDADWESLFAEVEAKLGGYAAFKGRIHVSAQSLREALDFDQALSRDLEKLYTYAHLKADEDTANQRYAALHGRAVNLHTRLSESSSFMSPEIQAIPDEIMRRFLEDPVLGEYRFSLEKLLRYRQHTLTAEIEEILAMGGEIAGAPSRFFSQLDNADLRFGMVKNDEGRMVELSHGNFISFLMSRNRDVRKESFHRYYKAYEDHRHSIATALSHSIKKDYFYSRVRKFTSCREASLFPDDVPSPVYINLISTVKGGLAPLFEYLRFRKEALGLDELHFYDTYCPIAAEVPFHMTYEEAVEVCSRALEPLGDDYTSAMRAGLLGGWVDRYENRGKRSGAYSSGCYDSPPYILMNYRDDTINSLYTLIHEAGHSMHSYYSNRGQPYLYHDYTIFVAEVASTFNEILLSRYLLDLYKDKPDLQAYILNREIDNMRGTLFRQTMFAEFEMITHELAEKNDPLTLETLTGIYNGLLKAYFGDTVAIDDALALECLRIPHFYSPFYVYKYATGISAAVALSRQLLSQGRPARERYRRFLGLGGSMFPLEELRLAGVDMGRPGPISDAIGYFEGLVNRLIAISGGQ